VVLILFLVLIPQLAEVAEAAYQAQVVQAVVVQGLIHLQQVRLVTQVVIHLLKVMLAVATVVGLLRLTRPAAAVEQVE
jgi:hypothetical protein